MTVSLEQFVQYLTQSGLMSAAEVSSFQDTLPPEKRPKDGETLARELFRANKLTKYQAQVVFQGKVKGLVFGDYRVLDKLGEGGMGVVLKAQHQRMDRTVAVKMISGASLKSPDAVKRFYREVKAAAKLNHPNIVQAYDASEQDGVHYLIMEYVEGKDLSAIVKEKGPLPLAQAVDYIIQAARGLQYAHKRGIVHRDIKPANLLLDTEGTVKILDMGLARIAGLVDEEDKDRLTQSGQVMGTLDYMAPEQAMDTHNVDARADIYSLGCTLYRLVAGDAMYKGDTLAKILIAHQLSAVPSLCKARSGVSPQLDAVYQKMVAKKPEDRQQSMADVITALETCIGKRAATSTSVGAESQTDLSMDENLSFLRQQTSPRSMATAAKKKVEKLAEETIAHQAAAVETSRQFGDDEKPQAVPRKKKTRVVAVGLGLLGVIGIVSLVITIRIRHRDGSEVVVTAPDGSKVSVSGTGDVDVNVKARGEKTAPLARAAGEGQGVRAFGSAPPPAVAPFDATKAKQHQEAWAKHLGVSVEQTNSIDMKLVLIPPGEFEMGSTPKEVAWALEDANQKNLTDKGYVGRVPSAAPRHHVKITKPFYLGTYQVTQAEYEKVVGTNPSAFTEKQVDVSAFKPPLSEKEDPPRSRLSKRKSMVGKDSSRHPVETVNWDAATEFCRKLSAMPAERAARRIYRLPTEAEWEYACRAGTTTRWYCGDDETGLAECAWTPVNASGTHPVGQKRPNAWGLYDMHGNVSQWCADWFSANYYKQSPPCDPTGPTAGSDRVLRGGNFYNNPSYCRSACRDKHTPARRDPTCGFRVVAEVVAKEQGSKQATTHTPTTYGPNAPPPAVAPFNATKAKQHQEAWAKHLGVPVEETNSIGMPLVLVPPGEFEMGSTPEEVQWALEEGKKNKEQQWYFDKVPSEAPCHHVKITKPFHLAMYQVTQAEYEKVMGVNPSEFTEKQVAASTFKPPLSEAEVKYRVDDRKKVVGKDTSRHPVETVNWDEAMEFCRRLSAMPAERAARRVYRLPTEAEWEYACRAGTATRWYSGDDEAGLVDVAWFNKNAGAMTQPVGNKKPNAWGLYDMSGNVEQWCADRFSADYYKQSPPSDPTGPATGSPRVLRGGSWSTNSSHCRAASRISYAPAYRNHSYGFRVVVGR